MSVDANTDAIRKAIMHSLGATGRPGFFTHADYDAAHGALDALVRERDALIEALGKAVAALGIATEARALLTDKLVAASRELGDSMDVLVAVSGDDAGSGDER